MIDEIFMKNIEYEEKLKLCIEKIVVSENEIAEIITDMAKKIENDYKNKKVLIVSILKGACVFTSDLIRKLNFDIELFFLSASSYGSRATSSGNVEIGDDKPDADFSEYDVIIVDDILDTGNTLKRLKEYFAGRKAKSVEYCVFLDKTASHGDDVSAKYIGKAIDDIFVVGYGLDYKEKFRNLPYVAGVKTAIYM